MKLKSFAIQPLLALALVLSLSALALADTIRLKDGTVIRGQVVGFRDQQFIILTGTGERGRRSRMQIFMEDVESIEFDNATGLITTDGAGNTVPTATAARQPAAQPADNDAGPRTQVTPPAAQSAPARTPASSTATPTFFRLDARVRADNTSNGWTNSGLVVRRGQRIRITAAGRVSLGNGRFATPAGLPTLRDPQKLMTNDPTGGLIAVIGDDNDDFLFIGERREFVAQRDGVLFLGVNEGNLNDNTGAFDVVIEAEAGAGATR